MTSFLDICYGYDVDVIGTVYYYLDANTFGMVSTWHYGILRGYCNCYFILICKCLQLFIYLINVYSIFNAEGGYQWIFPHLLHIPFLVAAVSGCSLPSSTYLNLIGYLILATAAA